MYTLAVSDHVMIAHSFVGDIFGPAQRLHGATYAVEIEVRRAELDADGLVCDIGKALETLKAVLGDINYHNLDELPGFKGRNTTTEFLAGEVFSPSQAAHRSRRTWPRHRRRVAIAARDIARIPGRLGGI